jgi:hypothetical protein
VINFYFVGRADFRQKRIDRIIKFASALDSNKIEFKLHLFSRTIPMSLQENSNVVFHGYRNDWKNNINNDYIMLLFSDYEGCPLCILEAVKFGFRKMIVYPIIGIETYVSKNCIYNSIDEIIYAIKCSSEFVNTKNLNEYYDSERFDTEIKDLMKYV